MKWYVTRRSPDGHGMAGPVTIEADVVEIVDGCLFFCKTAARREIVLLIAAGLWATCEPACEPSCERPKEEAHAS